MSTDRVVAREPSGLGVGMAHRARAQTVVGQRWSASGVVGAVGKASVGFGLAVGRSRAIRPTVRVDDLNSAALRPLLDSWLPRHDEVGGDDGDVPGTPGGTAPVDNAIAAPDVRRMPASKRRTPTMPSRARRHVSTRPRPTWTDQVIQRSTVGYTESATSVMRHAVDAPTASVPDDFVSSGDAKLDRLRLLVAAQNDGSPSTRRSAASPSSPSPSDSPRSSTSPSSSTRRMPASDGGPAPSAQDGVDVSHAGDAGGVRGDTAAGKSTGPGQFARTLRPELVADGSQPGRTSPSTPTFATPRATSPAPGSDPEIRRSRAPSRNARPDRLEELRAALLERGLLGEGESGTTEVAPTPPARRESPAPPSQSPSADESTGRPLTDTRRPERGPTMSTTDSPPSRRTDTTEVLRRATQRPTTPTPTRPIGQADSPRADGGSSGERGAPTSGREPGPGGLRAQRMLATGLAPVARALSEIEQTTLADTAGTTLLRERPSTLTDAADEAVGAPTPTGRLAESMGPEVDARRAAPQIETGDAPRPAAPAEVVRRSRETRSFDRVTHPQLPSVNSARTEPGDVVRRRVTLPRALSRQHRPQRAADIARVFDRDVRLPTDPSVSSLAGRVDTPPSATVPAVRPAARVSVVAPSVVGLATASENAMPATGTQTNGTSTAMSESGRSPSVVARGPGALLDVVRRTPADRLPSTVVTERSDVGATAQRSADAETATTAATSRPTPATGRRARQQQAELVASQFMDELSRSVRSRPAPLPTSFQPLADAIAGPRPVMLSTDAASRRALRSVGKVAATTGDTIHLDRSAVSSARLNEVMAHELTHIAAPSPAPRFFDDIDDSPEERRAEQVGRLMARSPLAPSASIATQPGRPVIRRSPAAHTSTSEPQTTSASDLVSRLGSSTGSGGGSGSAGTIRRWATATPSGAAPKIGGHRRTPTSPVSSPAPPSAPPPAPPQPEPEAPTREPETVTSQYSLADDTAAPAWFEEQLRANLQPLLRLIEDRMIVELERRGGRAWRRS